MTSFNLADLFEIAADAVPDRTAVVGGAVRRSYHELDERATRFGRFLAESGCRPGEHVLVAIRACHVAVAGTLPELWQTC